MKAKDIEDLINQKTKAINEKKAVQIHALLKVLRNQSLACLLVSDCLFLGILFYKFELSLISCMSFVLGLRALSSFLEFINARKK